MDGTLKDLGNGKYRCRVSFIDENGNRVQKSKTFTAAGKKDARELMREFKDACIKNTVPVALNTLEDLYKSFQEYHCADVQDSTKQMYATVWKNLQPYTNTKLSSIKPNTIKKMLSVAEKDSRTQKSIYQLLSAMYGYAIRSELLNYNPCTNVKAPKYKPPEKRTLSAAQKQALKAVLETQPKKYQAIYWLTLTLGFRREEVCALKWSDIDFENKILHINRTAIALNGQGTVIKEKGKTDKAISPLPLSDRHIELLRDYKAYTVAELAKWNVQTDFLFYQRNGEVINVSAVSNWFKTFCRNVGIEDITFHCLRHTCATDLLQNGVDLATVANILRDNIETVAKTYLHTDKNTVRKAVENLSQIDF